MTPAWKKLLALARDGESLVLLDSEGEPAAVLMGFEAYENFHARATASPVASPGEARKNSPPASLWQAMAPAGAPAGSTHHPDHFSSQELKAASEASKKATLSQEIPPPPPPEPSLEERFYLEPVE